MGLYNILKSISDCDMFSESIRQRASELKISLWKSKPNAVNHTLPQCRKLNTRHPLVVESEIGKVKVAKHTCVNSYKVSATDSDRDLIRIERSISAMVRIVAQNRAEFSNWGRPSTLENVTAPPMYMASGPNNRQVFDPETFQLLVEVSSLFTPEPGRVNRLLSDAFEDFCVWYAANPIPPVRPKPEVLPAGPVEVARASDIVKAMIADNSEAFSEFHLAPNFDVQCRSIKPHEPDLATGFSNMLMSELSSDGRHPRNYRRNSFDLSSICARFIKVTDLNVGNSEMTLADALADKSIRQLGAARAGKRFSQLVSDYLARLADEDRVFVPGSGSTSQFSPSLVGWNSSYVRLHAEMWIVPASQVESRIASCVGDHDKIRERTLTLPRSVDVESFASVINELSKANANSIRSKAFRRRQGFAATAIAVLEE